MSRFTDVLDRWHRLLALLVLIVALAAIPFVLQLGVNNSIEVWIDREGEAYRAYQEFLDAFGSEEYILVIYPLPTEIELDLLERLTDLKFNLEDIEGVRRVRCLSDVYSRGFGMLGIEAFRREIAESPFYRNFLVSSDGRSGAVWVELEGREQRDRSAIVAAVEQAIVDVPLGGEIYLAGSPVIDRELDRGSRRSSQTFFPLVFLFSGVLLLFFFPRPYGLVVPFLSVGTGIVWILALLALFGRTLNMVTVTLPPLLWVLGLSTSIHLLSRCRQLLAGGHDLDEAIRRAMAELARPCTLSALTTAFGFASLTVSSMKPVQEMGAFAAAGVLLCLASNFLLFPALARLCPPRPATGDSLRHPILHALAESIEQRAVWIVTVAGLVGLGLIWALTGLRADSNVIGFFKPDSRIAVTYHQVLAGFTGPYSVEVLLTPPGEVARLEVFERVDQVSADVASRMEVAKVISAADLVKKAHQRSLQESPGFHRLPEDAQSLTFAWEDAQSQLGDELTSFWHAESGTLRLSVLAMPIGSTDHRRLLEAIEDKLEALADWRPRMTGLVQLLVEMQERLLESQIRSFTLAFLLIGPLIAVLLRSPRYAAFSLAPNLMPILLALGIMSLFDIPLDPATIMIAGIALGIGVDDTLHFLERYLRQRRRGLGVSEAVDESLQTVGRAMSRTSVVAALGFFVLCFSEFLPLLYFGLFTAIAMLTALVAALVVLPALLLLAERRAAG